MKINIYFIYIYFQLDKLRLLLKLARVITTCGQLNLDTDKLTYIINKLMLYIASTKSLTQTASEFNKNCLLTICNVLTDIDQQVKSFYIY